MPRSTDARQRIDINSLPSGLFTFLGPSVPPSQAPRFLRLQSILLAKHKQVYGTRYSHPYSKYKTCPEMLERQPASLIGIGVRQLLLASMQRGPKGERPASFAHLYAERRGRRARPFIIHNRGRAAANVTVKAGGFARWHLHRFARRGNTQRRRGEVHALPGFLTRSCVTPAAWTSSCKPTGRGARALRDPGRGSSW